MITVDNRTVNGAIMAARAGERFKLFARETFDPMWRERNEFGRGGKVG